MPNSRSTLRSVLAGRNELRALFESDLAAVADPAQAAEWRHYLDYHARRYTILERVASELVAGRRASRVLDVGPMFETAVLRRTGATVDTLGFEHPLFRRSAGERHFEVDLNAPEGSGDGSYDLVVAAEVIEHLPTSPVAVLRYLATWMRPEGALLLQTPNAVALHKRLRMLAGRNPVEPIRLDPRKPGHFHEYTLRELRDAARGAGLVVRGWRIENHFGAGPAARAYTALGRVLPPTLRHGITLWLSSLRG